MCTSHISTDVLNKTLCKLIIIIIIMYALYISNCQQDIHADFHFRRSENADSEEKNGFENDILT